MLKIVAVLLLAALAKAQIDPKLSTSNFPLRPVRCGECRNDRSSICRRVEMKALCLDTSWRGGMIQLFCPLTCRSPFCPPCAQETARSCNKGEDTYCKDRNSKKCGIIAAFGFCNNGNASLVVREICKVSCQVCTPQTCSRETIQAPSCSPVGCRDRLPSCQALAASRLCASRKDVRDNCPLSCNPSCIPCPGSSGVQVLPPFPASNPTLSGGLRGPGNNFGFPVQSASLPTQEPTTTTPLGPMSAELCARLFLPTTTAKLEPEQECVMAHNYYRCLHGAQPLRYDRDLAETAKGYADKLADINSQSGNGLYDIFPSQLGVDRPSGTGENLHLGMPLTGQYSIREAVASWYAEGLNFNYDRMKYNPHTSYFMQLLWKDTTAVGCAVTQMGPVFFAVAHYTPEGNNEFSVEENVSPPIKDVCLAKCGNGTCQANFNSDMCECAQTSVESDIPECNGQCVVSCPKPFHLSERDLWTDSCEGRVRCFCDDQGDPARGHLPGAVCM